MIQKIRWTPEDSWLATLASLTPLWLLSVAILAEGFPPPPIPYELTIVALILSIPASIVLLWRGWLEVDLLLYTLFPLLLVIKFDEISTAYKTPFILLCALTLSMGIIGAKRSSSLTARWLILLSVAFTTWALASHAEQTYWRMVDNLVFGDCFPYTQGCPPLAGNETPWWALLLGP